MNGGIFGTGSFFILSLAMTLDGPIVMELPPAGTETPVTRAPFLKVPVPELPSAQIARPYPFANLPEVTPS